MEQFIVAFITGLTTGGLSCLAVQGGLLASSLANQIEQDVGAGTKSIPAKKTSQSYSRKKSPGASRSTTRSENHARNNAILPIALFLLAKIVVYTLMGALLGLLGSYLTLSPLTRAILMIAIGVFMVGNGLRMLNVHPIFRYFTFEPPKLITRFIRRKASGYGREEKATNLATPIFLGALTVLIPCGVTQVMMAAALASGSALTGATIMFAFTLGTSPVFFAIAYLATAIGSRFESIFMRFVAVVLLVLGLVSVNSGLNLMGSPVSLTSLSHRLFISAETASSQTTGNTSQDGVLQLHVENSGYFPETLYAKANQAVSLELITDKTYSCTRDFVIPALKVYQLLPETGTQTVEIPAQKPGTVILFTCSMGMYTGKIVFEG
jgi:sulfite exporter TauE/SafE